MFKSRIVDYHLIRLNHLLPVDHIHFLLPPHLPLLPPPMFSKTKIKKLIKSKFRESFS